MYKAERNHPGRMCVCVLAVPGHTDWWALGPPATTDETRAQSTRCSSASMYELVLMGWAHSTCRSVRVRVYGRVWWTLCNRSPKYECIRVKIYSNLGEGRWITKISSFNSHGSFLKTSHPKSFQPYEGSMKGPGISREKRRKLLVNWWPQRG